MDTNSLLANVDSLINNVYCFKHVHDKPIGRGRHGVAIKYVDICERRSDFIRELKNTICGWVYSKDKYHALLDNELKKRNKDLQNACAQIDVMAKYKFRSGYPQGQFGELLLFNFVQYFFKAPPLLRKMPITTNPKLERNGADAIHYAYTDHHIIYIGESKSYSSRYSFSAAFNDSISSFLDSWNNLQNELMLYVYDDFIDPKLQAVAEGFKEGLLEDVEQIGICLIAYNEHNKISLTDPLTIKKQIENIIENKYNAVNISDDMKNNPDIINRVYYVVFPIWNFDKLLLEFDK